MNFPRRINIKAGDRYGRWIIVQRAPGDNNQGRRWLCLCECGNGRVVSQLSLTNGVSRSCGCLRRMKLAVSNRMRFTTHGEAGHKNGTLTTEYRIWAQIIGRCTNQQNHAYKNYGGRGITVCDEWRGSYETFLRDVGRRPSNDVTIDRFDNSKGYYPGNVRWATRKEQSRNTRKNHLLTFNDQTKCISEWADAIGMLKATLYRRIHKGWPIETALTLKTLTGSQSGRISAASRWHGATREEVLSCV